VARIECEGLEAKAHGADTDKNGASSGTAEPNNNISFRNVRQRTRRVEVSAHFIVYTYAKGSFFGRSFSFRAPDGASCSQWINLLGGYTSLAKRNSSKIVWYKKYQARPRPASLSTFL
jgi:hypothetical protein